MSRIVRGAATAIGGYFGASPSTLAAVTGGIDTASDVLGVASKVATTAASVLGTVTQAGAQRTAAANEAAADERNAANLKLQADYDSKSTLAAAAYDSKIKRTNAGIYRKAAKDALQRGGDAAGEDLLDTKKALATRRATGGSSGTAVDTGTNLKLLMDDAGTGAMNARTIINNAQREAYGFDVAAYGEDQEANLLDYQAELDARGIQLRADTGITGLLASAANTRSAGKINAGTTLISGFADAGRLFL